MLAGSGILSRFHADKALAARTTELAAPTVIAVAPKQGAPVDSFVLPGNVTAWTDSPIYARTSGYLTHWYFDIGARVKKGALLAEISTPEIDQQLAQAQADLDTAQANANNAHIQADRYSGLVKSDAVSQQDTDTFVNQAAATAAAVKSAQANVQRLTELQSFEKVYAPFDGVVTARNIDTGQLIDAGAGKELFHVQAIQTLRVYANLPQIYSQNVKRGSKIDLTFAEHAGKIYQGTLARTADAIDPVSRTLLVEVDVDNRAGELLPGSLAQVHFKTPPAGPTFIVPCRGAHLPQRRPAHRHSGQRQRRASGSGHHRRRRRSQRADRLRPQRRRPGNPGPARLAHRRRKGSRSQPRQPNRRGRQVAMPTPHATEMLVPRMRDFQTWHTPRLSKRASSPEKTPSHPSAPRAPSLQLFFVARVGNHDSQPSRLFCLSPPSSLSPAANPSAPTTIAPALKPPQPTKKPAHPQPSSLRPTPPEAAGKRQTPLTECCAANGGRSTRTRSSTNLEDQISPNGQPNNQALRQAMETYLAARDQIKVARSSLYPTLSAGPSASRNQVSTNEPLFNKTTNPTYSDYEITGQASWEPDFFGRIRRTVEAARETAQASAAQMAVVDLSLHAEMASDYFQLRGLDSETKLLNATVADLEHQLDLTQRRLAGGVATDVDVAQARTQLETVRAQLIDVSVARAQYEHAIGTIANRKLADFSIPPSPLDEPENLALPQIPTGVPSQLLERRPDVANAERLAAAANAQIGIAISAYYPTITLGGTGGFQSTDLGTWIQGPSALWSLGGQATELLFDAGQRHALTDQARHTYEAQTAAYRNTIFQAFNDVEDQLSSLRILEQESTVEDRAVAAAQHSFDLSNQRYKGGVTSYLEVLTAETTLIQNQRTAIDLRTRQFVSSVGLVRSLGGSWDTTQLPK